MIALLAGLGKILVARMTDSVGDREHVGLFDNGADQSLVGAHRDFADRVAIESESRTQHQPFALRIEKIERADLDLHALCDRLDDLVEGLAQIGGGFATDRGDILDQSELVAISTHGLTSTSFEKRRAEVYRMRSRRDNQTESRPEDANWFLRQLL